MKNQVYPKSKRIIIMLLSLFCLTSLLKAQETNNEKDKIKLILDNIEYQTQVVSIYMNSDTARDAALKKRTDVQGKLTLKTGEVLEGTFRFEYRQTKDGKIPQEGGIVDGNAGKVVWYIYKDKKGKDKMKAYNAKDVSNFNINELESYHVVTYKPDLLKTMETAGEINANVMKGIFGAKTQKFLLYIYSTDAAELYFFNGEYILKRANDHFAIVGSKFKAKELSKFAKDCKSIADKALGNEYNGDVEQYIKFIDEYTAYLLKE